MSWKRRIALMRAGARDRAFSPAEAWLHRNGFPGLVPGFGTPRMLLRRPFATLAATLAWASVAYLLVTVIVVVDVLVSQDLPLDLLDTEAGIDVLAEAMALATNEALVIVCCLVFGILMAGLGIGRIAFFSIGWFARVAHRSSGRLLTVLPLLLVAVMFFFLAAETWQSVGSLRGIPFTLATGLIAVLAIGFLVARARTDLTELGAFEDIETLRAALPRTTRAQLMRAMGAPVREWDVPESALPVRDVRAIERFNVRAIGVLGKLIASLIVAGIVGVFFLVFGMIVVDAATAAAWIGNDADPLVSVSLWGREYVMFVETLNVSVFLSAFAALYFVVSATSDKDLGRSLSDDTEEHLRTAFAVRAVALAERRMRGAKR